MLIWITGLSGAGKTTLGQAVHRRWSETAKNTVIVDGDVVRELFKLESDPQLYSADGRRMVAMRIHDLCVWLDRQNINIVCCTISLFGELHELNRKVFRNYFEVFVDVPMDVLRSRDPKNLYAKAETGEISNVVGVDLPFEVPKSPDMRVDNSEDRKDFDLVAQEILLACGAISKPAVKHKKPR